MPHGGIHGPGGAPRPLATCEQQIVFELDGRGDRGDINTDTIEEELDSKLNVPVSVRLRTGRFDSPLEILVITGSDIVLSETFDKAERIVNSQMFEQNNGFNVVEWRIEGT